MTGARKLEQAAARQMRHGQARSTGFGTDSSSRSYRHVVSISPNALIINGSASVRVRRCMPSSVAVVTQFVTQWLITRRGSIPDIQPEMQGNQFAHRPQREEHAGDLAR